MDHHPVNLFTGSIDALTRSLDLRARKHEMILNNVANADTPNYQPFAMDVEAAMQQQRGPLADASMARTDPRHLPGSTMADDPADAAARSAGDNPLLLRGDRNGVDIDVEMAALAKNSLLYRASAQIISKKFNGLKNAISGGTK